MHCSNRTLFAGLITTLTIMLTTVAPAKAQIVEANALAFAGPGHGVLLGADNAPTTCAQRDQTNSSQDKMMGQFEPGTEYVTSYDDSARGDNWVAVLFTFGVIFFAPALAFKYMTKKRPDGSINLVRIGQGLQEDARLDRMTSRVLRKFKFG